MASIEKDKHTYFYCCLCDEIFEGYGNNPDPIRDSEGKQFDEDDECCDNCNSTKVIPARFKELKIGE